MDLGIKGKVALVTAASRGLGWAVAKRLSMEGAIVAICARSKERIEEAAEKIRKLTGGKIAAFVADVTDYTAVKEMVRNIVTEYNSLDILICNAGGPPPGMHHEFTIEDYRAAIELNLFSTINLCYESLPYMKEKKWGRIVAITSVAAKQPIDNLILSNTARAGVLGFIKTISNQVASLGITANCVCPGYTKTERVEELAKKFVVDGKGSEEDFYDRLIATIPAGRIGTPDEFAQTVAFLVSEGAGYINGVALQIDGGFYRGII
ncbi:MAG: SDR family oxidoreductase [Spirochaetes bacterium]|nr:SDR family oxidoreductase [Spirochaetota bacterium]